MPFGYIPNKTLWKDLALRILGYPNVIRRIQAPILMRMLQPQKEDVILDAGCGGGFFTYELAKKCSTSIGIDWKISKILSFAESKLLNLAYVKGDMQRLPFAHQKFDKILLSSVLQMVKNDSLLLRECHRILGERGTLVLSVPMEYIHLRRLNNLKHQLRQRFGALGKGYYTYNEVGKLLKTEGFKIIEAECAPKKWGSLIYEISLFLWYSLGLPVFSPLSFPLLYLMAYLDKLANSKQKGNEIILKAEKVSKDD
jgi:SAM-dependent methyltransferase